MTTSHPSDAALLALHHGEATTADRTHVVSCATCALRRVALARDLDRIATLLALPVRTVRRPRWLPAWLAAPLVAAAAAWLLMLAPVRAPAPDPGAAPTGVATMVQEVADAVFDTDPAWADDGTARTEEQYASTCALDEPFFGLGCVDDD